MTEFALIAPILFALVFGIFDFGRGMSANVTVTNAAREAARYEVPLAVGWSSSASSSLGRYYTACPSVGTPPGEPLSGSPQAAAWQQLEAANLDLKSVTMVMKFFKSSHDPSTTSTADDMFTCNAGGGSAVESPSGSTYVAQTGDWVQFEVRYVYSPVTPIIGSIFKSITIDQTTTMVLE
jgi:Flp pilus assembly protein TadG